MSPREPSSLFRLSTGTATSPEDLQELWSQGLEILSAALRRSGAWQQPWQVLGSDPTVDWRQPTAQETLLAEGLRQSVGRSYGYLQALAASGLAPDPWLPLLLRDFLEHSRRCHDPLGYAVSLGLRRAAAMAASAGPSLFDPEDPYLDTDSKAADQGLAAGDPFELWWTRRGPELTASLVQHRSLVTLEARLQQRLPELVHRAKNPRARLELEERLTAALRNAVAESAETSTLQRPIPDLLQQLGRLPEARDWPRDHRLLACVQEAVDHLGVDERATDRLRTVWLLLLAARSGRSDSWPGHREADASETHEKTENPPALAGILRRLLRACDASEDATEATDLSVREQCLWYLLEAARPLPKPARHRVRVGDFVVLVDGTESFPFLWLCVEVYGALGEVELLPTSPLGLEGIPQLLVSTPLGPLQVHGSFPCRRPLSQLRRVPGNPALPRDEVRQALTFRPSSPQQAPPPEAAASWTTDQLEHWSRLHRAAGPRREDDPSSSSSTPPWGRGVGCLRRLVSFFSAPGSPSS